MGILDGALSPMDALAIGLIGGRSNNFGTNAMDAIQFQQALMGLADRRKLAQQQIESGGIDLENKKQGVLDDAAFRQARLGAPDFSQPSLPSMAPTVANAGALAQQRAPSPYEQSAKMVQYLRSKNIPEQYIKPYIEQMEKLRPKSKADQLTIKMPDGSIGLLNIADDGTTSVLPYKPAEEQKDVNLGGSVGLVGKYTGALGGTLGKTMEPGKQEQLAIERGNLGVSQARLGLDLGKYQYETGFTPGQSIPPPTGQFAGLTPKGAQEVRGDLAKKQGEAQLAARQALPDVAAQTQQTIKLVDDLINHPGFSTVVGAKGPTGVPAALGYGIPGTDAADFVARKNQLLGQQFMQAYSNLKGGGQITEVEGKKATDAIARMDTAMSENEFKKAAVEFKEVLAAGLKRAQVKAGVSGGFKYIGTE